MSHFLKPDDTTSTRMIKVRSKGTGLEQLMESLLVNLGVDFEKQPKIIGKPDFRLSNTKILIFCDSSFWHGRHQKDLGGKSFKRNKAFWVKKLRTNKVRDKRVNLKLKKAGWKTLRFWDTTLKKTPKRVLEKIRGALNTKT